MEQYLYPFITVAAAVCLLAAVQWLRRRKKVDYVSVRGVKYARSYFVLAGIPLFVFMGLKVNNIYICLFFTLVISFFILMRHNKIEDLIKKNRFEFRLLLYCCVMSILFSAIICIIVYANELLNGESDHSYPQAVLYIFCGVYVLLGFLSMPSNSKLAHFITNNYLTCKTLKPKLYQDEDDLDSKADD